MANERKEAPRVDIRPGPGGGRGPMSARLNAEKPKNGMKTLGRLLGYIGRSRIALIVILAVTVTCTLLDLAGPLLQQKAIDTFSLEGKRLTVDFDMLMTFVLIFICVSLISAVLNFIMGRLFARLSQSTVYTMRRELFEKISRLPVRYTDTHKHGDIMSRMTNDVDNVSTAITSSLSTLVSAVLTLIGAFVMMLRYNALMTFVAVLTVPVSIAVSVLLGKFMRKYYVRNQVLLGKLNGVVEETVTGYRTVVAYGREKRSVGEFGGVSGEYRKSSISARVWGSVMGPVMNFVGNLQYVLIAITGGYLFITGKAPVTPGVIQAMLQYSKSFSRPINMIANQYAAILTALAGAERIFEILDSKEEPDEGKSELRADEIKGNIEFSGVNFSYVPEKPVLRNFNLKVDAGKKIAIVGATGSGKTTVVNLLTRFYETDSGSITIDGVDIRDLPLETLRNSIAIVLQDTVLFSDTIGSNIRYGRLEATDEEMRAAAHTAMADGFIERLPEGYGTQLTEAGSNLSQGQRQLLSISRAVLADPRILILDEATSSVDTRTEMDIQTAMVALMKNRTSLIIAHRLSTIRDADMIVVLKDGAISESGSHEELLERGGEYYKLYSSQFAGIET